MGKMGGEWQGLLQSILLGLIISFLLAKLISLLLTRPEPVSRHPTPPPPSEPNKPGSSSSFNDAVFDDVISTAASEQDSMAAEIGSSVNSIDGGDVDDDDWEGVESTELDELFSAATTFVAATAADSRKKVSNDVQLQLYGLYKIATEGPCSSPQPSALKMTARAKWQAWQKMGAMPPEDAMQKYIEIVTELYPDWAAGAVNKSRGEEADAQKLDSRGPMGPVFSTFVYEEESSDQLKMDAIHAFAREGEAEKLLKCLESGILVDLKDSEGRTPLHWAVDRGHFDLMELLVSKNADVNAKDNEGQTPLHYAAMCEREAISEFLVKHGADSNMKDQDGNSPCDLCNSDSSLMLGASVKQIG